MSDLSYGSIIYRLLAEYWEGRNLRERFLEEKGRKEAPVSLFDKKNVFIFYRPDQRQLSVEK